MDLATEVRRLRDADPQKPMAWTAIADQLHITRDRARRLYSRAGDFEPPRKVSFGSWSRRTDWGNTLEQLKDGILEDIRTEAQEHAPAAHESLGYGSGYMLEVSPFDVHIAKLAWHEEAGENYDVKIARQRFHAAISDLLERVRREYPLELIAIVIGNDFTQTDTVEGTTTGGTYVDTDTRYIRMFRYARQCASWAIREAAATGVPVRVVIVPGNHDRMAAFHLGEVLDAEFKDDSRVTVDNTPPLRKYFEWGTVLLGWTHGSEEKQSDLPNIMAHEQRSAWGRTTWHEWHTGHLHKSRETRFTAGDSFNGTRVRTLPALCTADGWHAQHGYVGEQQGCEAYLWHKEAGYCGHYFSNAHHPLLTPSSEDAQG